MADTVYTNKNDAKKALIAAITVDADLVARLVADAKVTSGNAAWVEKHVGSKFNDYFKAVGDEGFTLAQADIEKMIAAAKSAKGEKAALNSFYTWADETSKALASKGPVEVKEVVEPKVKKAPLKGFIDKEFADVNEGQDFAQDIIADRIEIARLGMKNFMTLLLNERPDLEITEKELKASIDKVLDDGKIADETYKLTPENSGILLRRQLDTILEKKGKETIRQKQRATEKVNGPAPKTTAAAKPDEVIGLENIYNEAINSDAFQKTLKVTPEESKLMVQDFVQQFKNDSGMKDVSQIVISRKVLDEHAKEAIKLFDAQVSDPNDINSNLKLKVNDAKLVQSMQLVDARIGEKSPLPDQALLNVRNAIVRKLDDLQKERQALSKDPITKDIEAIHKTRQEIDKIMKTDELGKRLGTRYPAPSHENVNVEFFAKLDERVEQLEKDVTDAMNAEKGKDEAAAVKAIGVAQAKLDEANKQRENFLKQAATPVGLTVMVATLPLMVSTFESAVDKAGKEAAKEEVKNTENLDKKEVDKKEVDKKEKEEEKEAEDVDFYKDAASLAAAVAANVTSGSRVGFKLYAKATGVDLSKYEGDALDKKKEELKTAAQSTAFANVIEGEIKADIEVLFDKLKADDGKTVAVHKDQVVQLGAAYAKRYEAELDENKDKSATARWEMQKRFVGQFKQIDKDDKKTNLSEDQRKPAVETLAKPWVGKEGFGDKTLEDLTKEGLSRADSVSTKPGVNWRNAGSALVSVGLLTLAWDRIKAIFSPKDPRTEQEIEDGVEQPKTPWYTHVLNGIVAAAGIVAGVTLANDAIKGKKFGTTAGDLWTDKIKGNGNGQGWSLGGGK